MMEEKLMERFWKGKEDEVPSLHLLIEAVVENDVKTARRCLEAGVDPNQFEDQDQLRPLHFAVLYKALDVIPLLLEYHADIHAKATIGITPLNIAEQHKRMDLITLLKNHKTNQATLELTPLTLVG